MTIKSKKKNDGIRIDMNYRNAPISIRAEGLEGPSTLDEETRSVGVVMASETPVLVYDYDRGRIMEILLMSGAQLPDSGKLVLLETHSRYDTSYVVGSCREITVSGKLMKGRAFYSTAPEAESPWIKTREGHLTDYSIGYRVDEATWVPEGQIATIDGKKFKGPVSVATKWTPRELSVCCIGADQLAKARADINDNQLPENKEVNQMDPKLRKFLERSGLPVTATEEEALAFLENRSAEPPANPNADIDKARAEATGKERDRIREIDALLTRYDCQDMARELIIGRDGNVPTLEDAQRKVMDLLQERSKKENPGYSGIRMGAEDRDKFRAAAEHALELRAGMVVKSPAPGAQDIRGYTLVEMARECLRVAGLNYHGSVKEMVGRALTSSDFPNILANLATKSMQLAWDSASETWQVWCGIGSVSDFKLYYDNALSEHDDLEEVPDSGEIKYGKFTEKLPETYKAATYAKKFRVTRVMIINDDMGALTEMPARRAEAAARKVGDVAYAVLTANGNMGDGHAIFDSTNHANDALSGYKTEPGIAAIAEGIRAMKAQKDIGGKRRLNIRAEYFIAPTALEGTSEVFFLTEKFSDSNTVATDSSLASTRANPYAGSRFTRIYEPRLDDDDDAAWYLAGPKGKTVKVVFLNGVQAPMMEMLQPGFTLEGFEYMVAIDVGAYATDYRGLYRNEGD